MSDITANYINTPFAYTKQQKGLTLLQQNLMVCVVSHLQKYVKKYFDTPELVGSTKRPKPMLSEEDKKEMLHIRANLSELGVSSSVYSRIEDAKEQLLQLHVEMSGDDNGIEGTNIIPVFSRIFIPDNDHGTTVRKRVKEGEPLKEVKVGRSRGWIDFYINEAVLDEIFDMSQGYVSHPADIARIGKVDNMPLMYYLIRHEMRNFKSHHCGMSLMTVREYLGMVTKDPDGKIIKMTYPKYARFKERILKTALDDIKRLYDSEKIDVYFEMEEIRPRGKKTGDPSELRFTAVFRKVEKKPEAVVIAADAVQQPNTVAETQTQPSGRSWQDAYQEQHGDPTIAQSRRGWANFCASINDPRGKAIWLAMRTVRIEGSKLLLAGSDQQIADFKDYWDNTLIAPIREQVLIRLSSECMRRINGFAFQQAIK